MTPVLKATKTHERTGSIPVVVVTSSSQERDLVECYKLGVTSDVQKPVGLQNFQETAREFGMYWLMVNHVPPTSSLHCETTQGA